MKQINAAMKENVHEYDREKIHTLPDNNWRIKHSEKYFPREIFLWLNDVDESSPRGVILNIFS
jgi:hypothetical protein